MAKKKLNPNPSFVHKKIYALVLTTLLSVTLLPLTGCNPEVEKQAEQTDNPAVEKKITIPPAIKTHIDTYSMQYVEQMLRVESRIQDDSLEVNQQQSELTEQGEINQGEINQSDINQSDINQSDIAQVADKEKTEAVTDKKIKSMQKNEVVKMANDMDIKEEVNTDNNTTDSKAELTPEAELQKQQEIELQKQQEAERSKLASEFKKQYMSAMEALFTEAALSTEQMNTLINMVTILPEALENEDILAKLNVISPALARLVNQHRIWSEIQEKQRLEVQKLQQERIEDNEQREKELDEIAVVIKEKIQKYDQKIVKYEKQVESTK